MPIFPNEHSIVISNPYLGKGTTAFQIGQISTELFLWLRAKFQQEQALAKAEQTTNDPKVGQLAFTGQSLSKAIHDFNMRSLLSAVKSYDPPLATLTHPLPGIVGRLTQQGETYANLVQDCIYENLLGRPDIEEIALNQASWTQADHVFVNGEISLRQARMLQLLQRAVYDAEQTNRKELDERFKAKLHLSPGYSDKETEKAEGDEETESEGKDPDEPNLQILDVVGNSLLDLMINQQRANDTQDFQAIVLDLGLDQRSNIRQAFVPTAIFGTRARTDMKNLTKYGLVDLKAYATGNRGRPKHIVRVSPTGAIVLDHLERLNLL